RQMRQFGQMEAAELLAFVGDAGWEFAALAVVVPYLEVALGKAGTKGRVLLRPVLERVAAGRVEWPLGPDFEGICGRLRYAAGDFEAALQAFEKGNGAADYVYEMALCRYGLRDLEGAMDLLEQTDMDEMMILLKQRIQTELTQQARYFDSTNL
ncbi:MAG: hypothetical protein AAF570_12515, partial [Bacteroidota bacterium]